MAARGGPRRQAEVSVVITNHNYGRFLAAAAESALSQGDLAEVIVVDDGSTDDSQDVLARLDHRVRPIVQDNAGQASAFNAGFAASTGRIVLFLDADDLLEPDVLEPLTSALASGAVHAHWQLRLADAQGRATGDLRPPEPGHQGDLRAALADRGPGFLQVTPTSGNAYTRRFLDSALPMPTAPYRNGGGDLYLSWLAAASGPVVGVGRPLSRYRRHGANDNISGSTDVRVDRGLAWARHGFTAVAERLGVSPLVADRWAEHEWWHQIDAARAVVRRHVPADGRLLVADDFLWAVRGTFADRVVEQLAADDPTDADAGLVERMRAAVAAGSSYLVLASYCRWWLEHYPRWASWIRSHAVATHVGPTATVFALGPRA